MILVTRLLECSRFRISFHYRNDWQHFNEFVEKRNLGRKPKSRIDYFPPLSTDVIERDVLYVNSRV